MKVEKRGNSVFISHNDLTIFVNKFQDKETHQAFFNVRVHKAEKQNGNGLNKVWKPVGMMDVEAEDFMQFVEFLAELKA